MSKTVNVPIRFATDIITWAFSQAFSADYKNIPREYAEMFALEAVLITERYERSEVFIQCAHGRVICHTSPDYALHEYGPVYTIYPDKNGDYWLRECNEENDKLFESECYGE